MSHFLIILGPCFENDGRPVGDPNSTVVLECEDDDGTYELRQTSRLERWCVFPNNGSEIPGSRVTRPSRVDCRRFGKYTLSMICYDNLCASQYPV